MKTCKVCNIEKDDTCYNATYGNNGQTYLMNTCKECLKLKRQNKNKPKPTIDRVIVTTSNKDFTDKEILEVVLNKNQRIHTVFNLDMDIRDKIKELAADKNLNLSDVANLIFKRFFS